jgi:hypothetical protein
LRNLKNNKVAGTDGIHLELIKYRGNKLLNRIYELVRQMWEEKMEENRVPRKVLYMNLETMRPRGRPRNRWQVEVREDGRLVDGVGWKERVYNREEWKRLLKTARNRRILHMPVE